MAWGPSDLSVSSLRQRSVQLGAQLESRIAPALRAELVSLATESDPELWAAGILRLADRMDRRGQSAEALLLLENLLTLDPKLAAPASVTLAKAERLRQAWLGGGRVGDRAERLIGRFVQESTDPVTLASFVAGGSAYKVARGALLARGAARYLASAGAFAAEVPAFVLTSKLGRQVTGHSQDWSPTALTTELSAAGIGLLFLKSAGALSQRALAGLRAYGAWQSAPGLARFTSAALPQLSMFGGILLGHRAEVGLGLRPPPAAGSSEALEALAALLQFQVGGRLSDGLLGARYQRTMRELELRSRGDAIFSSAAWNPGRVAALPGAAGGSADLFFPGFFMSSKKGDKDGKTGQVIPLFPNAKGRKSPPAKPVDAEGIARLRVQLTKRATIFLEQAAANFGTFLSGAETYASHLDRGLKPSEELAPLDRILRKAGDTFLEHYVTAMGLHRDMTAYAFGNPETSRSLSQHEVRRNELRDFIENARDTHQAFKAVMERLGEGDSVGALKALNAWYHLTPYFLVFERSHVLDFGGHSSEVLRASRLLGMGYGMLARDLLQDPSQSGPLVRQTEMKKLLVAITGRGERPYSRAVVSRFYPGGEQGLPTPREGLAQGGSYGEPFRSWLGLHLPALLLLHQGQSTAVAEMISAVELFMEPALAKTSRETLKWLGDALERKGDPRDWAREAGPQSVAGRARRMARELNPSPELAAKILGTKGPQAILAHSLHAFFRAGHQPALALDTALQAPEALREEVLGLSGALIGAYTGRGPLSRWFFLSALRDTLPNREIGESMFSEWELGLLALPLSYVARPKGFPSQPMPFLRMMGALEKMSTHHPKWVAFYDGFFERQTESEIVFHNVVGRATDFLTNAQERRRSEDWRELGGYLGEELKKIEAGVGGLKKYLREGNLRLESGGLSPVLGRPLFEDLEARQTRLQDGLTAYRRFMAGVRFRGVRRQGPPPAEELKPLREKLLTVIAAFDVPEGAPFESALAKNWLADYKRQLEAALRETP